ncbi:MAG: zinc ribbon domain-containing protein [Acidobacteria bacterium]|nr:zinc ribbon domain-containing protein [Acidobacteriota bacterium]
MPLYEYRCKECGKRFELIRRFQDADGDLDCPHCQSEQVERQISSFISRFGLGANCGSTRGFT